MRTLRDARNAIRSLGQSGGLSSEDRHKMELVGDVLGYLENRLGAIEDILRTLAGKAGVSADDAAKTAASRRPRHPQGLPTAAENEVRRILG